MNGMSTFLKYEYYSQLYLHYAEISMKIFAIFPFGY